MSSLFNAVEQSWNQHHNVLPKRSFLLLGETDTILLRRISDDNGMVRPADDPTRVCIAAALECHCLFSRVIMDILSLTSFK